MVLPVIFLAFFAAIGGLFVKVAFFLNLSDVSALEGGNRAERVRPTPRQHLP